MKLKGKTAIFLDIDGTLVSKTPVPAKEVITAIKKARDAGHFVFVNTGRSRGFIDERLISALEVDGYICAMGQYFEMDGKIIRNECFTKEQLEIVKEVIIGNHCGWFETTKTCFGFNSNDSYTPVDFSDPDLEVTKISMMGILSEENVAKLKPFAKVYQHPHYFETSLNGYSKGRALLEVSKMLGIDKKNTIAMGDSRNDKEMIEVAGIGVAMGNALEEIKSVADFVTKSVSENGVSYAIENLLNL
ncbi:MAG: HAD hydrolase family protein [Clostridia bacterium]|nr:HAD hydrolase family protein [Clostridia bacterium]